VVLIPLSQVMWFSPTGYLSAEIAPTLNPFESGHVVFTIALREGIPVGGSDVLIPLSQVMWFSLEGFAFVESLHEGS